VEGLNSGVRSFHRGLDNDCNARRSSAGRTRAWWRSASHGSKAEAVQQAARDRAQANKAIDTILREAPNS
jgi:hypothetical protein